MARWLETLDGHQAAAEVEEARVHLVTEVVEEIQTVQVGEQFLHSAIEDGRAFDAALTAAKQQYDDIGRSVSLFGTDLSPHHRHFRYKLFLRQTATWNPANDQDQRALHKVHEDEVSKAFQDVWPRATCAKMCHTLARELRDMVYDKALGPEEHTTVLGDKSDPTGFVFRPSLDHDIFFVRSSGQHVPQEVTIA
ncbi:hypothetical protein N0V91_008744 [Didymella pomorum]|uniref:Uncharacterized protein n=1 Tax=Didymella pomorum TaxID=749634 RepID=A0A9W8Z6K9_9PLEO|nr:hypothetical protein N0V91_008744 [Didymella pomorum]